MPLIKMNTFPTGNQLADTNILLELTDQELGRTCRSSVYLNSLCSNDYFWKLRLEKYYPTALSLRRRLPSYQEVYRLVRNQAYLIYDITPKVYNDIRQAYNAIISDLRVDFNIPKNELPPIERAEELPQVASSYGVLEPANIHALPEGTDQEKILLKLPDLCDPRAVISPFLSEMPVLQPDLFLIYRVNLFSGQSETKITKLTSRGMEEVWQAAQVSQNWPGSLLDRTFSIQRSDNQKNQEFRKQGEYFCNARLIIARRSEGEFIFIERTQGSKIRGPLEGIGVYFV